MSSVIIVNAVESANWVSCKSIGSNIHKAYKFHLKDFSEGHICLADGLISYAELALTIVKERYSKVVIIDYRINPVELALQVSLAQKKKKNISFIVHVYGDFTLNLNWWSDVHKIPKNIQLRFIAASKAQRNVVTRLLGFQDQKHVEWIPFPVDTDLYKSKKIDKLKLLKKFNLPTNKQILVYAGRISDQKNVVEMVHYFKEYNKCVGGNAILVICGTIDDLGVPYLGRIPVALSYANKFAQVVDSKDVIYLGNRSQKDLSELYCLADYYISLSTHNDEDYGMSPAEALCCGTPALLSSWAGYRSFHELLPNHVDLIPVEVVNGRYNVTLKKTLLKLLSLNLSKAVRIKVSKESKNVLGYKNIGKRYIDFIKQKLPEISISIPPDTQTVIDGIENNFHKTFVSINVEVTYNRLYQEIYRGYYE